MSEKLSIPGPAGPLEALLDSPQASMPVTATARERVGVVCHPHPLYGGTMTNKVAHILARTFAGLGAHAIRFNFRGVGASSGEYAEGIGETDDALAVAEWATKRWPGAELWLAGFSFGGAVAIRASVARSEVARLVTVAPAIDRVSVDSSRLPCCPWLLVQGNRDDLVDPARIKTWATGLERPPAIAWLEGADHFFHGRLNDVRDAIVDWVGGETA
jgi:alpha/beta superfamily hydrolase